jgi:hypothetical protein
MIPAGFAIIIIDLKDCFFILPLHDNDKENLPLHYHSLIMKNQLNGINVKYNMFKQGMKNSPTICHAYVLATFISFYKNWSQIKYFHYMDDLLIAYPSFTLLQQASET